ncbi:MAG: S8 family serine peptidase, partial [Verrucomicrobiae bacterium]|nr:S8 family serine peptidase [Verrucomicrobiae bacterium]
MADRTRVITRAGIRGRMVPLQEVRKPTAMSAPTASAPGSLVRLQLDTDVDVSDALARLRLQPGVAFAEPNFILRLAEIPPGIQPTDFEFPRQWALENDGQYEGSPGADISAPAAWAHGTGDRSVRVAVIDSGIDYFHPDLEANVWVNDGEIAGNGQDDDANGYIDDVHGYDFVSGDGDPMDDQGHGTHVAGIIGAVTDNGKGVAGVCWEATLMAVKAFDENGEAAVSEVVTAIDYAVANGAALINASWGSPEPSLALQEAIRAATDAGVLVVSAAGNGRTDDPYYPSAMEEVVSVAATNSRDQRAPFSNFGPQVDLDAPGELVLSTMPNARYELLSGTSMAAPHVTGVASLILSQHPEFTIPEVVDILRNAVDEIRPDHPLGTGRLNALKAVQVTQPLPTARLRLPETLSGLATLEGTAAGEDFVGYRLDYGVGDFPDTWVTFHTGDTPVAEGPLVSGFDTSVLHEGVHAIRLQVMDSKGQTAVDRGRVIVRNVFIESPAHNDIVPAGRRFEITGTVFGQGRTYTLEHGPGWHPTAWSVDGIETSEGGTHPVSSGTLGWWDTRDLPADSFQSLRLVARNELEEVVGEWVTGLVYLDGRLRPGWPQYLPSEDFYPTNDWRDVHVADLDADGRQEIIRVHPGGVTGAPAELRVFDLDGSTRWTAELGSGEPYSDIPAIGDVDGDGRLELFAETGEEGRVHAFRFDGSALGGGWPVQLGARRSGKVLADLDRDGFMEVICYAQLPKAGGGFQRQLAVFDHTGRRLADWKINHCVQDVDVTRQFPAVGNFD